MGCWPRNGKSQSTASMTLQMSRALTSSISKEMLGKRPSRNISPTEGPMPSSSCPRTCPHVDVSFSDWYRRALKSSNCAHLISLNSAGVPLERPA